MLLTDSAVEELVASKSALTEFTTATLVHMLAAAAVRAKKPDTPANQLAQMLEAVRKVRADLTGQDHERQMPTMMVNIQLGEAQKPPAIDITPAECRTAQAEQAADWPAAHDGSRDGPPLNLTGAPPALDHTPDNLP